MLSVVSSAFKKWNLNESHFVDAYRGIFLSRFDDVLLNFTRMLDI